MRRALYKIRTSSLEKTASLQRRSRKSVRMMLATNSQSINRRTTFILCIYTPLYYYILCYIRMNGILLKFVVFDVWWRRVEAESLKGQTPQKGYQRENVYIDINVRYAFIHKHNSSPEMFRFWNCVSSFNWLFRERTGRTTETGEISQMMSLHLYLKLKFCCYQFE